MVNVILYALHFIFFVYIFVRYVKEESLIEAVLNGTLIIILFTVGYSVFDFITQFFIPAGGLGKDFTRDSINLTLLSIIEFFFYKGYYFGKTTSGETEK